MQKFKDALREEQKRLEEIIAKAKKCVYLKAPIAAGARAALPRFSSCSGVPKRNLSIYVLHWSREGIQ